MREEEVRDLILRRAARYANRKGSTGVTAWGKAHGVSRSHLSEFMAGKRGPTSDVLDTLNLEWRIVRKRPA
jgi:hypothetical protein